MTVTVAWQVMVPLEPVAVPVYVVVTVGDVLVEPAETGVTSPMLLSMENEVAFVVVHESVEESPGTIESGSAESVQASVGGGGAELTVTVAVQVAVPPEPVTVAV